MHIEIPKILGQSIRRDIFLLKALSLFLSLGRVAINKAHVIIYDFGLNDIDTGCISYFQKRQALCPGPYSTRAT